MKEYSINQSPFYKCHNKKKLAKILGVSISELRNIGKKIYYREFINKKGRVVYEPNSYIKKIQSKINDLIGRIEKPYWLQGGIKKRSNITNSMLHKKSYYFLILDIKKFFENCQRYYVYLFFKNKMKMSSDCSNILADICTYNGKLVTGSPSSVLISFFSYEDMFINIFSLLDTNQVLSVYVDDITISSTLPIVDPHCLKHEINSVLKKYGHSLNLEKSKYYGKSEFKKITGVVVSPKNELKVPNDHRKKIVDGINKIDNIGERSKLSGRLSYASQIEPNIFPTIKAINKKIHDD
ncbi:reverse transcriptase family protein [Enterococcus faecium]|uniref:reverse transcriptase family protein n=1 Tax=Enterococcus TaxID=1350 RepID=UPI00069F94A5|nr:MULTISPECIES: reverse transcriptase family protein [Enterococcus]MDQ8371469.1 reverse transcriptase family protein [Enterococcus faecium]RYJ89297.1 RNA-directed DNA polymerase [Enterococcus faecium]